MAFGTLFRYGVPLSFVYCTVYQQNIWREADEHLMQEQKRVWRDFFNLIDNGYHTAMAKLSLSDPKIDHKGHSLVSKFDALDMRACWNTKVQNTFCSINHMVSNPKAVACKIYRKIQPYVSSSSTNETVKTATSKTTEQLKQ